MKATIEQLKYLAEKMERAQKEHPKATIYYDWENSELRITYPVPRDIYKISDITISENHSNNEWEKELMEEVSGSMNSIEGKKHLVDFIRQLLLSERQRLRDGIEGLKKRQTKHFSRGIEVEHHGQRPCNENCILNGKEQGGEYNQALSDILKLLE